MSKVKRTVSTSDTSSLETQYMNIMKNFDFDQVQEYMSWEKSRREYDDGGNCIGKYPWKMYIGGAYKVPSIEELKECARELLDHVIEIYKNKKHNHIFVATGPFKVTLRYGILELDCVIESWSDD